MSMDKSLIERLREAHANRGRLDVGVFWGLCEEAADALAASAPAPLTGEQREPAKKRIIAMVEEDTMVSIEVRQAPELPPLPPAYGTDFLGGWFTADQMRAYAKSAIESAVRASALPQEPPRFFMDHGLWHDRETGQHLYTQDQYDANRGPDWQQRCLDAGFKYWRAPDAHGVTATVEQATALLQDLLGVEVEIAAPSAPATPPAPLLRGLAEALCRLDAIHWDSVKGPPNRAPWLTDALDAASTVLASTPTSAEGIEQPKPVQGDPALPSLEEKQP